MSKEILKARFVNFGELGVAVNLLFSGNLAVLFLREFSNNPYMSKNQMDFYRQHTSNYLELLNMGGAPVPRIEKTNDSAFFVYKVITDNGKHRKEIRLGVTKDQLSALNTFYGKEAEIYEPKKFEANWVKIFPSEISIEKFSDGAHDDVNIENVLKTVAHIEQTEANSLEVWELTITENTK